MATIRAPAVAGLFYPEDAQGLREEVRTLLDQRRSDSPPPKAIIAPHAGLIYSGPIAASVYAQVANGRDTLTRVVVLGPSHHVPFRGLALSGAEAFATPLGLTPVDTRAVESLVALPQVQVLDRAHAHEHSLEMQLPFLQSVLGDFTLVPLVVGSARSQEVHEVLSLLWGGAETLIVVSSDLSHYHDYLTARQWDLATSQAILDLRDDLIDGEHACGYQPVNGLLAAARHRGLCAEIVDQRNSGDTAGPRDRVVGYGAYAFRYAPSQARAA